MIYTSEDGQSIDFWANPELPTNPKKVGIRMSGGADSTALLFLLCEHFKDNDLSIQAITGDDVSRLPCTPTVNNILNIARNRYKNLVIPNTISNSYNKELYNFRYKVPPQMFDDCDVILHGSTCEPPILNMNRPIGRRNEVVYNESYLTYTPMVDVDKRFVKSIFQQLNLMNDVFPLVKSCVNLQAEDPKPCKSCVWCQEKLWAFGEYDYGIKQ